MLQKNLQHAKVFIDNSSALNPGHSILELDVFSKMGCLVYNGDYLQLILDPTITLE